MIHGPGSGNTMSQTETAAMSGTSGFVPSEPPLRSDGFGDDEEEAPLLNYGRDILVVDDNDTNLIAIEAALLPLGRKMVLARSGVEALARLLEQDFALIVPDVA